MTYDVAGNGDLVRGALGDELGKDHIRRIRPRAHRQQTMTFDLDVGSGHAGGGVGICGEGRETRMTPFPPGERGVDQCYDSGGKRGLPLRRRGDTPRSAPT